METVTLTINISKNIGAILEEKAKSSGQDVAEYVEALIEKDIDRPEMIDEILAPFRREVEESGMSEGELDELIKSERQAMYEEKYGNLLC